MKAAAEIFYGYSPYTILPNNNRSMALQPIFKKTRIAPTPSGFLHLGNILSFSITASLAASAGARILLRIDDIDRERTESRYVRDIFDTLRFMDIPWDEGPRDYEEFQREFSQVHRMELYKKGLEDLRATGRLFACECSRNEIARVAASMAANGFDEAYPGTCRLKQIAFDQPGIAWRILTDAAEAAHPIMDIPPSVKDFVVKRKDGFPAYQLTSLIDDSFFAVDGVIRGKDLRASTQAQRYLSCLLPAYGSFGNNYFFHHPLLPDPFGEKLSKSAGATSVQSLRNDGRSAEEIYTRIAQMLGHRERIKNFMELAALVRKADVIDPLS
jgi:glutamyl/glutaminyl-tRNA synthetase